MRFVREASAGGVLPFLAALARDYGPVSSFPFGSRRIVLIDDAGLIEEILVTRQHEFVRDSGATLLRELVGTGLLTTEDPPHLQRRRLKQPAFHRSRVAGYAATIVTEVQRTLADWRPGRRVDLGAEMARLTLAAVGSALFGSDLRDETQAVADVLARVMRRGNALGAALTLGAPVLGILHRLFPERSSLVFPRERAELESIVAPLVARRRDAGTADLLSMLLDSRGEDGGALDDAAVTNEAVMLILAGHETTANALTWTWLLLSAHPLVERKLLAEVDRVLAGRRPVYEDLARLPFTAHVFDEALRLYPPAAAFARRPLHTISLGGYTIPKMTSIFVSPFVTQRNPRYFQAPGEFRPERWERAAPLKLAYFPFGAGSKMCIGEPFARMEGVLAIAAIASRFRLRRISATPIVPGAQALLRPATPVYVEPVRR